MKYTGDGVVVGAGGKGNEGRVVGQVGRWWMCVQWYRMGCFRQGGKGRNRKKNMGCGWGIDRLVIGM